MLRLLRTHRLATVLVVLTLLATGIVVAQRATADTPSHLPFGSVDQLIPTSTGFEVSGWAIDPDTTAPIQVAVYDRTYGLRLVLANGYRPDVANAFAGYGANHGFDVSVPYGAGTYTICVFGINVGAGTVNAPVGCKSVTIDFNPRGALALKGIAGGITASGWAVDPSDPTAAVTVGVVVDGVRAPLVVAGQPSAAPVPAFVPAAGPNHGFTSTVMTGEGTHHVCLYLHNIGAGTDVTTACQSFILNDSPLGQITSLAQVRPGSFQVSGWAFDPDSWGGVTVHISVDGTTVGTVLAVGSSAVFLGHGFTETYRLPNQAAPPGDHTVCATGDNLGAYGHTTRFACSTIHLDYNPVVSVLSLNQAPNGALVTGWALDPDTYAAISVRITADGTTLATVPANQAGPVWNGHDFSYLAPIGDGTHTVCAIAVNVTAGSGDSAPSCRTISANFNPVGALDSVTRLGATTVQVTGWAYDPDTTGTVPILVTIDGTVAMPLTSTGVSRPDVAARHPGTGSTQGYVAYYAVSTGEHTVCAIAANVGPGSASGLGCKAIYGYNATAPSAPQVVTAVGGYGGAIVNWQAPVTDGGAPVNSYTVTASPGGASIRVDASATTATVTGLAPSTSYHFSVVASNAIGTSPAGVSAAVTTQASPPAQTSPAPISTSRYTRNISSATGTDLATMRAEGAADAAANPSGHGYLILLDIGGQDQYDGGVVLSATTHYVSYGNLVQDLNAYVDGYASAQKFSAPLTLALGTNNDMDVSSTTGGDWARLVVNPVRSYAAKYSGITIAGANDIEPGFSASQAASSAWVSGFLSATSAPFVFNGSADGCSWTVTNAGCNNGWSMSALYSMSAGAAPTRIVNLPQIYNTTMAAQWKFISLTGVGQGRPRINFGGPLTEWTACQQAGCGSLTGNSAWSSLWSQLQSDSRLAVGSLPYSTDLRIDQ